MIMWYLGFFPEGVCNFVELMLLQKTSKISTSAKNLLTNGQNGEGQLCHEKYNCKEYDPSEVDKHYKRWARYLLHFCCDVHSPPRLGKIFRFTGFRLLKNCICHSKYLLWPTLRQNSIQCYYNHPPRRWKLPILTHPGIVSLNERGGGGGSAFWYLLTLSRIVQI